MLKRGPDRWRSVACTCEMQCLPTRNRLRQLTIPSFMRTCCISDPMTNVRSIDRESENDSDTEDQLFERAGHFRRQIVNERGGPRLKIEQRLKKICDSANAATGAELKPGDFKIVFVEVSHRRRSPSNRCAQADMQYSNRPTGLTSMEALSRSPTRSARSSETPPWSPKPRSSLLRFRNPPRRRSRPRGMARPPISSSERTNSSTSRKEDIDSVRLRL
jgi:hypothetical protein